MKLPSLALPPAIVAALALLWLPSAPAVGQTATYTALCRLGGDPNGYHPQAGLVLGADGNFYGTTEAGGPANCGTIFQISPAGALTTIYSFTGGSDGGNPATSLTLGGDGNFYGTTYGSFGLGSASTGSVFRVTPAGALTTIYRFSALAKGSFDNSDGAFPNGSLVLGSDGNLYGTTEYGGANGVGTVFRITLAGALKTICAFDDAVTTNSFGPAGALAQGSDGNFYGTTAGLYGANSGTIYQVTPAGALTTLYRFTGGADGAETGDLSTALTPGADGNFYGTTPNGKAIFQITPAGAFTVIHTLNSATEGSGPSALVLGKDGNFYGTTNYGGPGGYGTIYQVTPAGAVTALYSFANGSQLGFNPNPLIQAADGAFYGTTQYGGNGDAGMVYSLNASNALTPLYLFTAGGSQSMGKLLETVPGTFVGTTSAGGATGGGTVFGCTSAGAVVTAHSFNAATEGGAPASGFVLDAHGDGYATTSQGGPMDATNAIGRKPRFAGSGGGTIIKVTNLDDFELTVSLLIIEDYDFDYSYGFGPTGELEYVLIAVEDAAKQGSIPTKKPKATVAPNDGVFYGTTEYGGDNAKGTIYSYTPGGTHLVLYQFGDQPGDGSKPLGGLTKGNDGNLYGVTQFGGANNLGTVFSITPAGTLTTLYSFAGTGDGAIPAGALALGSDGNFYGATQYATYGSSAIGNGNGTIFEITAAGTLTTLHTFAGDPYNSEGGQSKAALIQASDGNFYGTTSAGGIYPASDPNYGGDPSQGGTVFSITPAGVFSTIHAFGTAPGDGTRPLAALVEGTDGNLYGTTANGGTDDCGVVFKVALSSLPSVTLTATKPEVTAGSGDSGKLTIKLSQAQTSKVIVHYTIKGTAVNGTDYVLLTGKVKFKPGKTKETILITPLGDLGGAAKKTVKITLTPAAAYTIGTAGAVKVKILGGA